MIYSKFPTFISFVSVRFRFVEEEKRKTELWNWNSGTSVLAKAIEGVESVFYGTAITAFMTTFKGHM